MSRQSQCHGTLARRLQEATSRIRQVRELCQVPSISLGVVHEGKVVFRESVGYRDAKQKLRANADTIYMLGSCSKMFTSAAVAMLVSEGKLQWLDPVKKHLPEFDPEGDARIGQNADLIDLLRHSTGVTPPGTLCLGPRGTILTNAEDLVQLLNMMPTADKEGQRFNRHWQYNNFTYGLVAEVVESVTGQRFMDFVRERILQPLGMTRTALARADMADEDNFAAPCATLDDGRFIQLASESWPCEDHSPLLAATGMRSSINDMLKWCMAVLSAERTETQSLKQVAPISDTPLFDGRNNPLKEMSRARRGYWTRPADDPSVSKDASYCMGWIRMDLPSSMLGAFSGNRFSREKDHRMHLKHILGMESDPILAIGHTGGMLGSIATVWTFPDTQSAVVTMTNGRDFGDASDFAAQILIQALFVLTPRVDLTPWVKTEVDLAQRFFDEGLLRPWKENRRLTDAKRDPLIYVGEYRGFRGLFTLSVISDTAPPGSGSKLALVFNHRKASTRRLVYFRKDVYSFFPEDRNTFVADSMIMWDYRQSLLEFELDCAADQVTGLWWLWDTDEKPAFLRRT